MKSTICPVIKQETKQIQAKVLSVACVRVKVRVKNKQDPLSYTFTVIQMSNKISALGNDG